MHPESARFLELWQERPAPPGLAEWLREFAARSDHRGALVHWETLPARPARFGELALPLPPALVEALETQGIRRLYTHQVHAIERLRAGLDTVVVTGTASGKSLCYLVPVIERLVEEPEATALLLFPTKALAQDQLKGITRLTLGHPELVRRIQAGVYDGDTQVTTRRKLRDHGDLILSNLDMLHQGILPPFREADREPDRPSHQGHR